MLKLPHYRQKINNVKECAVILGQNSNKYLKSKRLQLIKINIWILPHKVIATAISGDTTFYTYANESGKTGYKSGNLNKVSQSS